MRRLPCPLLPASTLVTRPGCEPISPPRQVSTPAHSESSRLGAGCPQVGWSSAPVRGSSWAPWYASTARRVSLSKSPSAVTVSSRWARLTAGPVLPSQACGSLDPRDPTLIPRDPTVIRADPTLIPVDRRLEVRLLGVDPPSGTGATSFWLPTGGQQHAGAHPARSRQGGVGALRTVPPLRGSGSRRRLRHGRGSTGCQQIG